MCRRDTFKVRALLCLRADLALVTRGGRLAYGGDIVAARTEPVCFAGFHTSSASRDPERNVSVSAFSSMNSVLLNAWTMARSLSLAGGAHSLRVKATSLMATRFSARSLSFARNVLQPVEPDSSLSLSVRDAGLSLRVLKPCPFSSTQE